MNPFPNHSENVTCSSKSDKSLFGMSISKFSPIIKRINLTSDLIYKSNQRYESIPNLYKSSESMESRLGSSFKTADLFSSLFTPDDDDLPPSKDVLMNTFSNYSTQSLNLYQNSVNTVISSAIIDNDNMDSSQSHVPKRAKKSVIIKKTKVFFLPIL